MDPNSKQTEEEPQQLGFWKTAAKAFGVAVGAGMFGFFAGLGFHAASSMMKSKEK